MTKDEPFMLRCIQIARLGQGKVAPNPLVGALIVHNNRILGEGFHERYAEAHAEVNAIQHVSENELLRDATLYVSLEPCSHFGKTPPCSHLIVEKGIKKVVVGMTDPNPLVAGSGIEFLRSNGVEVISGVLTEECAQLNKSFVCAHTKKRPFITLKWAQSEDGFLDDHGKKTQISTEESKVFVHQLRANHQSILVGKQTVLADNPELNLRYATGNDPIRVVLDSKAVLGGELVIFNNLQKTLIYNELKEVTRGNTSWRKMADLSIHSIVSDLFAQGIHSVLVEGGASVLQQFIDSDLWDEAYVFVASKKVGNGTKAPLISHLPKHSQDYFGDTLFEFRR